MKLDFKNEMSSFLKTIVNGNFSLRLTKILLKYSGIKRLKKRKVKNKLIGKFMHVFLKK